MTGDYIRERRPFRGKLADSGALTAFRRPALQMRIFLSFCIDRN
jgi:hypothetical protein